jgi:starvation-inducible outer membrane lipoprotein
MRAPTLVSLLFASVAALGLAGCGDAPQELAQGERRYQGKPDTNPWDSPQFGGKQAEWERAIQARTQNQNEYTRVE